MKEYNVLYIYINSILYTNRIYKTEVPSSDCLRYNVNVNIIKSWCTLHHKYGYWCAKSVNRHSINLLQILLMHTLYTFVIFKYTRQCLSVTLAINANF